MKHLLFVNQNYADILPLIPFVEAHDVNVSMAHTLQEALSIIRNHKDIDIVIADTTLPDGKGLDLARDDLFSSKLSGRLFLTGDKQDEILVKQSIADEIENFFEKPLTIYHLKQVLQNEIDPNAEKKLEEAAESLDDYDCGPLVGKSPQMQRLYHMIKRVAPTNATVFIIGQSGSGKELVAEAIYRYSQRHGKPWIAINCGAISSELVGSALFGHEKGSFTGAAQSHKGYFEQASGGTIFLDEITETSLDLQVKLLRVLETGTIIPVGGKRQIKVDVRIIASTNRSPLEAVKAGVLREDLYFRLNVFPLFTPPLNKREGDILLLAHHFLSCHNKQDNRHVVFSHSALEVLNNFQYVGNVRELKNLIHRAYILADDVIDIEHLNLHAFDEYVSAHYVPLELSVNTPLALAQKQFVNHTLQYYDDNIELAAKALNVSVRELKKILKKG